MIGATTRALLALVVLAVSLFGAGAAVSRAFCGLDEATGQAMPDLERSPMPSASELEGAPPGLGPALTY